MIFVTGATGFIGKNLLKKLLDKNFSVRALVRDKSKISKINNLEVVDGDLLDKEKLFKATENVDVVIHLAAVVKSFSFQEYIKVNVEGTRNLIDACLKNKTKKIIYISSLDACLNKTNCYGESKALGEKIIIASGIDYIILRPALVYGRGSEAIVTLAGLIKKLPVIPVVGSGKAILQPVYVNDVCHAIINLLESNLKNKLFYLAGEERISIDGLIDKIAKIYSKKVIKIHVPLWLIFLPLKLCNFIIKNSAFTYDSLKLSNTNKICDMNEIKSLLNFKFLSLDEGLIKTLGKSL
jgi:NADH dehydrogenase